MTKSTALIVAAGQGTRLGQDTPKQYLPLGRRSIIETTLERFITHPDIDNVICVISKEHEDLFLNHLGETIKHISYTYGGKTRQVSVYNGLKEAQKSNPDRVLIHDAARPFIDDGLISSILKKLETTQSCLPLLSVSDSLKRVQNDEMAKVNRDNMFLAQTPQGFVYDDILRAHEKAAETDNEAFTDDIAIAEWSGLSISHIEGSRKNFKITTKEDYDMAKGIISRPKLPRFGHGYDVHAFEEGDEVVLCGVSIPHNKKLKGHSDADVALHAITDAIYGAIGAGDIGHHFPPTEPEWKGASSDIFLKHAVSLAGDKGGEISNLDITLVCESPKIGPHRDAMRTNIARITGLDMGKISVKATTSEGLGFTGRGEGISAFATACILMDETDD